MLYYTLVFLTLFIGQWAQASYKNQSHLVQELIATGYIKSKNVKYAMLNVDRKNYVEFCPYEDYPVAFGLGATFNIPHTQAVLLEALSKHIRNGSKVLDAGCGTGYLTVCMALMAGEMGYVIGIEHVRGLVDYSRGKVLKDKKYLVKKKRVRIIEGDGRLGAPEYGPYDAILIGAVSVDGSAPEALIKQLNKGGRLIVLVYRGKEYRGETYNELLIVDKSKTGRVTRHVKKYDLFQRDSEYFYDEKSQMKYVVPNFTYLSRPTRRRRTRKPSSKSVTKAVKTHAELSTT